ncbi:hypothetical protein [Pectobacterium aroidearum]|uniref:hypothetical protein n=1 Tax=Pectobacterium aroidearum TaxID=1201031 RepID=UPI00260F3EF3|nr:hypothetical protein [Pectobacterium aroidearum]WKA64798.1 hypothetical protein QX495_08675 [Pectobacterium aroidearum]
MGKKAQLVAISKAVETSQIADEDSAIIQPVKVKWHWLHSVSLASMLLSTVEMIEALICPVWLWWASRSL